MRACGRVLGLRAAPSNRAWRLLDAARPVDHGQVVTDATATRGSAATLRAALPPSMGEAVTAYERHLRAERGLSSHTVRGYLGDAVSLLDHAARMGGQDAEFVTIAVLRSW